MNDSLPDPDNQADALAAMARGDALDTDPDKQAPADEPLAVEDAPPPDEVLLPPGTGEDRRARAAGHAQRQQRAHLEQFKKTLLPVLATMSVLVLAVGVGALVLLSGRSLGSVRLAADGSPRTLVALIAACSFPVAGILMLGVWSFRRDVRHGRR